MRLWEMYNIPRNKMPQINKKHLETYPKKLMVVDINTVTPSQSDRVPGMVDKTLAAFKAGEKKLMDKPMVVDRDMNIVNGHHRYDALKQMGMTRVPVLKVDATLPELINDFGHTTSDRPVGEGNKAQKGIPANATDAQLKSARKAGGAKGKRAHWLLNMRKGNRKRK